MPDPHRRQDGSRLALLLGKRRRSLRSAKMWGDEEIYAIVQVTGFGDVRINTVDGNWS
jgi:hypothetical protein